MTPWLRGLQAILAAALALWVFGVGPIAWLLRDGLGPDAADSSGTAALLSFVVTFYWGPIALACACVLAALELLIRRRTKGPET